MRTKNKKFVHKNKKPFDKIRERKKPAKASSFRMSIKEINHDKRLFTYLVNYLKEGDLQIDDINLKMFNLENKLIENANMSRKDFVDESRDFVLFIENDITGYISNLCDVLDCLYKWHKEKYFNFERKIIGELNGSFNK